MKEENSVAKTNINWLILFYSNFLRFPLFTKASRDLDLA